MTPLRRIRQNRLLRKWHRRIGLVAALLMIWMAVSGIALNHADDIGLPKLPMTGEWLRKLYKLPEPALISFHIDPHWLTQIDGRQIFLNKNPVDDCRGKLVGAEAMPAYFVAVCSEELLLIDSQGQVLERINSAHGLPTPLSAATLDQGRLLLQHVDATLSADLDQLQFLPVPTPTQTIAAWRTDTPTPLRADIIQQFMGRELNAERVLHDLHSGRLLGLAGTWLLDLTGAMVILLSLTGCWLWWRHVRHARPHS